MRELIEWIDSVPPLTLEQWLVCVLPLLIAQAIIFLPASALSRRRRK